MSDVVRLTRRAPIDTTLEVEGVTAERFAGLDERDIAELPVWLGRTTAVLGDFFLVRGGHSSRVLIEGATANIDGLAAGSAGGEMVIEGDTGRRTAAGMTGGSVEVRGSVGDEAGLALAGGVLRVTGRAGERLGAALPGAAQGMTGGEIVVGGSVGADAAARARRGLVVVMGDAGARAARAMLAGSLVVFGRTAEDAGRANKRGSLVAIGGIAVPETYRYACTFQSPHIRLLMTYLRRRYLLAIDERIVAGAYRRYCGDVGIPGRGEILTWVSVLGPVL